MTILGIKEISLDNICERDLILNNFLKITQDGQRKPIDLSDYLNDIMAPHLIGTVPKEIKILFEVARGTMAYGYFYYPLFAIGLEQLFRVTEAAVSHKCKALGASPKIKTFAEKINWLVERGIISNNEKNFWHASRVLRNIASHPDRQMLVPPGMCISLLKKMALQINSIFRNSS